MKSGLLSIVMVSYNHALYLREAIQSVISQTYKNWELIIVDDGSTDNSLEIAADYIGKFPSQIKLFSHSGGKNLGISSSYALGLSLCQGEFIGFLEPEDMWSNVNAETKINSLLNYGVGFVYSNIEPIGDSEVIDSRKTTLRIFSTLPSNLAFEAFPKILITNFVPSFSAVILKNEVLQNLKFISNRKYAIWLDWFLWIQISRRTKFLFIPQKLVSWRLYRNSYCNNFLSKQNKFRMIIFEIKYRIVFLREIILSKKVCFLGNIKNLYLFGMAFIKRAMLFFRNAIIDLC